MKQLLNVCFAFILVVGIAPTAVDACTYVRAYLETDCPDPPPALAVGTYIEIVGGGTEINDGETCESETFTVAYAVNITDGCGGTTDCEGLHRLRRPLDSREQSLRDVPG
jgi:hypothetical protein